MATITRSPSRGSADGGLADEQTPLLRDIDNPTTSAHNPSREEEDEERSGEQTIIPDQPSKKLLIITLGAIYVGVFLGALDSTVIATLSAPISTSFNSLSLLSWLASAYLIANAACQPLAGRLTDIFSRRTGLLVSNVLFAVGNLICGLAGDEWVMIAGRVVAGMGGGGLMAISTFVGSDLVPLRRRGFIQGIGNICYGTGAGLGGIFGGWVNDVWGWRVAFLAQVPLVVISGILVFMTVNIPPKKSEKSKLSRVDFLGAFTLVVTLVLFLLGLNSGGNIVPWSHPLVTSSLVLSAVFLVAFIYIEARIASEPVIPVKLLLNRTVAAACLTNWFIAMVVFAILFYVPIFFQVKGLSTTAAGMQLIPQSIGASVGSLLCGFVMNHTGKYRLLSFAILGSFVLGTGLICTLTFDTPNWPAFIYLFLIGTGYGGTLTVTLLALISAVSHDHQAVITSASYAFRSTGSTIGVTIASAVYQNILVSSLHQRFDGREGAAEEIRRIRDSFDELKHLPPGWRQGVLESYELSFRGVFLTAFGLAVTAFVCGAFMRQHTLHTSLSRNAN
ncbi:MFS multidrug transporter-like protein [Venustampulla echinocandica]|uniref:MFS multidrug transporter-like protein n=1 Tax=Venustampulla echinocandica TaxID=2656787 RepID=A0A370TCS0_9HELO|nr:MFS multidrug transporter-like protein [Venustampulla echinocandica]RDL32060.1 MFS multidrug transporter-like protein [Venustampulla echinocandica]